MILTVKSASSEGGAGPDAVFGWVHPIVEIEHLDVSRPVEAFDRVGRIGVLNFQRFASGDGQAVDFCVRRSAVRRIDTGSGPGCRRSQFDVPRRRSMIRSVGAVRDQLGKNGSPAGLLIIATALP